MVSHDQQVQYKMTLLQSASNIVAAYLGRDPNLPMNSDHHEVVRQAALYATSIFKSSMAVEPLQK